MLFALIYQSILLILFLTFSMGPAFFAMLNVSLTLPKSKARFFAGGIVLSDLMVCFMGILIIHFGFQQWLDNFKYKKFMGILAGSLIVLIGGFFLKPQDRKGPESSNIRFKSFSWPVLLSKGFFLNFLNPSVWIMWLGNITVAGNVLQFSFAKTLLYFSVILFFTFSIELLKIHLASKLKKFISGQVLRFFNTFTGVALMAFGFYLMYFFYFIPS
ncbi:MAG: LysE family transporter [Bacteroidia bacterium]|nr:LysE family transporter [Bacteroidia bacterium]